MHHQELGEKRCMIKCLELTHEWTHEEVDIIQGSGNSFVNRFYEAGLVVDKNFVAQKGLQAKFIKQKYKKHLFRNHRGLEDFLHEAKRRGFEKARKRVEGWKKRESRRSKTFGSEELRPSSSRPSLRGNRSGSLGSLATECKKRRNDHQGQEGALSKSMSALDYSQALKTCRPTLEGTKSASMPTVVEKKDYSSALKRCSPEGTKEDKPSESLLKDIVARRERVAKAMGSMAALSSSLSSLPTLDSSTDSAPRRPGRCLSMCSEASEANSSSGSIASALKSSLSPDKPKETNMSPKKRVSWRPVLDSSSPLTIESMAAKPIELKAEEPNDRGSPPLRRVMTDPESERDGSDSDDGPALKRNNTDEPPTTARRNPRARRNFSEAKPRPPRSNSKRNVVARTKSLSSDTRGEGVPPLSPARRQSFSRSRRGADGCTNPRRTMANAA